jgi:hypothetical protein
VSLRLAAGLAGAAVLNALFTFVNLWPTPWVRPAAALSVEVAVLVLAIGWLVARGAWQRRVAWTLTALASALVLVHYAEVTAVALYGRPVNLYWDVEHLPRVAAMLAAAVSPVRLALIAAGVVAALAALVAAAWWSVTGLARAMRERAPRRAFGGTAAAVVALYAAGGALDGRQRDELFAVPVVRALAAQAALLAHAGAAAADDAGDAGALAAGSVAALGAADVYLVFVESYGAATFTVEAHRERLAPARAALEHSLQATGRSAASAFYTSPTFGGASWLAHASVMAARDTRSPDAYNRVLASGAQTLVHAFARHGRRTVALMPGLRQAWPEGGFYAFDAVYGTAALDYRGPAFGWWRIPDQYSLARLEALEVSAQPRAPLFVFFPTITSHAPFRPTPPYQPDWERLLSAAPFDASVQPAAMQRDADWLDLAPAFGDAIGYTLRALAGYLERRRGDDLVMIVLGDHQPPAGVAGEHPSWDVPVHVIATRAALLEPFIAAGFAPGLVPREGSRGPLHALGPQLLHAFAAPGVLRAGETRVHVAGTRVRGQAVQ